MAEVDLNLSDDRDRAEGVNLDPTLDDEAGIDPPGETDHVGPPVDPEPSAEAVDLTLHELNRLHKEGEAARKQLEEED